MCSLQFKIKEIKLYWPQLSRLFLITLDCRTDFILKEESRTLLSVMNAPWLLLLCALLRMGRHFLTGATILALHLAVTQLQRVKSPQQQMLSNNRWDKGLTFVLEPNKWPTQADFCDLKCCNFKVNHSDGRLHNSTSKIFMIIAHNLSKTKFLRE